MPIYRVLTVMESGTSIPADSTTNTWHFDATSVTPLGDALDEIEDFYDAIFPNYTAGGFSGSVVWKAYDLSDPEPRIPVATRSKTYTMSTAESCPAEVAVVLSFRANYAYGSPNARRRGRVYLGPFNIGVIDDGRPSASYISAIRGAAVGLLDASTASTGWSWVVYSPTDDDAYGVTQGWIDTAFGTQRRRGWDATVRTTWPDVLP